MALSKEKGLAELTGEQPSAAVPFGESANERDTAARTRHLPDESVWRECLCYHMTRSLIKVEKGRHQRLGLKLGL